ncbi:Uncharacterised protein [uncultured Ruminococcus sp.]|nr:Uncharacterised protein [uncultured Ruminococcus sp.]
MYTTGDKLLNVMKEEEIGISELARISGVPERTILDIMAGVKEPELGVMCKIAEGLGICVHELRADEERYAVSVPKDTLANTGYLNDFLNAVISEGVREGITDIFGQGVEIDNSEAVQTARRAKELLDKLAEYKPLAKVEELTEQNYNMIDNVLNNGAEKKEQEQTKGRISIKEKMAEKRAVIEQRDKMERTSPEKETEKKSQREM